jgi:hypothetical protein
MIRLIETVQTKTPVHVEVERFSFDGISCLKVSNTNFNLEFRTIVQKAIHQLFQSIKRRCSRLAVEDAEFFAQLKVVQSEEDRKIYRQGTKLCPPPDLKPLFRNFTLDRELKIVPFSAANVSTFRLKDELDTKYKEFPGCLPLSILRKNLEYLWNPKQMWCFAEKTNGTRLFLLAMKFNDVPICLWINRSYDMFLLENVNLPKLAFNGTLFDGELVSIHKKDDKNDCKKAYIVFDTLQVNGISTCEYNYLVRLQIASFFLKSFRVPILSNVDIRVKEVYAVQQLHDLLIEMTKLDHQTDGLILTSIEAPVCYTNKETPTIFKFKMGTDHTIDFMYHNQTLYSYKVFRLPNQTIQMKWVEMSRRINYGPFAESVSLLNNKIVECRFERDEECWKIEMIRKDKRMPNVCTTVWKTKQNIDENLSLNDICIPGTIDDHQRQIIQLFESKQWNHSLFAFPRCKNPLCPVPVQSYQKKLFCS